MLEKLSHLVQRGRARTSNPYRGGLVVHPTSMRTPESGRDRSDLYNQHTTCPKKKGKRV